MRTFALGFLRCFSWIAICVAILAGATALLWNLLTPIEDKAEAPFYLCTFVNGTPTLGTIFICDYPIVNKDYYLPLASPLDEPMAYGAGPLFESRAGVVLDNVELSPHTVRPLTPNELRTFARSDLHRKTLIGVMPYENIEARILDESGHEIIELRAIFVKGFVPRAQTSRYRLADIEYPIKP